MVIHQVGPASVEKYDTLRGELYLPLGLIQEEMVDLYKAAHIIISRAGAGTVATLLALKKRSIFVPLKIAAQDEQLHNAQEAQNQLNSQIIQEDDFAQGNLEEIIASFEQGKVKCPSEKVINGCDIILEEIKKGCSLEKKIKK